jgi:hypothetical protein
VAKLTGGVLGTCRGAVGKVVAFKSFGRNVLKARPNSFDPATPAQLAHRSTMGNIGRIGGYLTSSVFNVFTDRLFKKSSGYNQFVKDNASYFVGSPSDWDYANINFTYGDLHVVTPYNISVWLPGNSVTVYFSSSLGNNGKLDDPVHCILFNPRNGFWIRELWAYTRTDGMTGGVIPCLSGDTLHAWIFFHQNDPDGKLNLVSVCKHYAKLIP